MQCLTCCCSHMMIRCEAAEVHWHAAVSALHFAATFEFKTHAHWRTRTRTRTRSACLTLCFWDLQFWETEAPTFTLSVFFRKSSSRWALPSQGERRHVPCALTESCVSFWVLRDAHLWTASDDVFVRVSFFLKRPQTLNCDVKQHTYCWWGQLKSLCRACAPSVGGSG